MSNLLDKRFLVIADYPDSNFSVSTILQSDEDGIFEYFSNDGYKQFTCLDSIDFQKYPHLFRELQWWEMRDENELPEYVKFVDMVYKVIKHHASMLTDPNKFCCIIERNGEHDTGHYAKLNPATLEEYEQYIKSLK